MGLQFSKYLLYLEKISLLSKVISISLIVFYLMQFPSSSKSQNCCYLCEGEVTLTVLQGITLAAAFFSTNVWNIFSTMYEKANNIYSKCNLMLQSITCFPQTFSIQTSKEMEKKNPNTTPYILLIEFLVTVNWTSVCHRELNILS